MFSNVDDTYQQNEPLSPRWRGNDRHDKSSHVKKVKSLNIPSVNDKNDKN